MDHREALFIRCIKSDEMEDVITLHLNIPIIIFPMIIVCGLFMCGEFMCTFLCRNAFKIRFACEALQVNMDFF